MAARTEMTLFSGHNADIVHYLHFQLNREMVRHLHGENADDFQPGLTGRTNLDVCLLRPVVRRTPHRKLLFINSVKRADPVPPP